MIYSNYGNYNNLSNLSAASFRYLHDIDLLHLVLLPLGGKHKKGKIYKK